MRNLSLDKTARYTDTAFLRSFKLLLHKFRVISVLCQ